LAQSSTIRRIKPACTNRHVPVNAHGGAVTIDGVSESGAGAFATNLARDWENPVVAARCFDS
jgi:hypothetical protein